MVLENSWLSYYFLFCMYTKRENCAINVGETCKMLLNKIKVDQKNLI